jgi:hypothetical protein
MGASIFASGSRPDRCHHGHPWTGGGTMILSWQPCDCPAATGNYRGHHRISCQHDGCRSVWKDPACDYAQRGTMEA